MLLNAIQNFSEKNYTNNIDSLISFFVLNVKTDKLK